MRLGAEDLPRLLKRCQAGDAASWAELVRSFEALVYSVARRAGLDEDDSADVFMHTFRALSQEIGRLESGYALPRWLATTAARQAIAVRRQRRPAANVDDLSELLASEDRDAGTMVATSLESEALHVALERLGGRCRDLLTLLYFEEGVEYREVSAKLGMPVGAIGPTRARCLEKLRKEALKESAFADVYQASGERAP